MAFTYIKGKLFCGDFATQHKVRNMQTEPINLNHNVVDTLHILIDHLNCGMDTYYGDYCAIMEPDWLPKGWEPVKPTPVMLLAAATALVADYHIVGYPPTGKGACFVSSISDCRVLVTPNLKVYVIAL